MILVNRLKIFCQLICLTFLHAIAANISFHVHADFQFSFNKNQTSHIKCYRVIGGPFLEEDESEESDDDKPIRGDQPKDLEFETNQSENDCNNNNDLIPTVLETDTSNTADTESENSRC